MQHTSPAAICAAFLALLLTPHLIAQQDPPLQAAVRARFGVERFQVAPVALPDARPVQFTVDVPWDGRVWSLELRRHSLRSDDFRVLRSDADGPTAEHAAPPVATYRGRIRGRADSVVLAALLSDGLSATVLEDSGRVWSIEPLARALEGQPPELHAIFEGTPTDSALPPCGNPGRIEATGGSAGGRRWIARRFDQCQQLAEIAFDADFEYYQAYNSSVDDTVAVIESYMNQVDYFYARDVRITHAITAILVRTEPFYAPTGGGNLLDLFRAEWENNHGSIPRDLTHLMTGKPGSLIEYGGLAWVGVVCGDFAYGWSMDSAGIIGHEIGHNWGAGHCHDVAPCNNMCGACLYIAPNTRDVIFEHRNSRGCLERGGVYRTPVPPYTYPERLVLLKDELVALGSHAFDVLGNDDDGNCEPLQLAGFDALSERGAPITLSPGTGPDGRDELLYAAPPEPFVGTDRFSYTAADPSGLHSVGEVVVEVRPNELAAYWKLDEGAGSTAGDSTAHLADGELAGAPVWTSGSYSGGLEFDGLDDSVAVPPLDLNSNRVTITTWIRRNGQQGFFKGIVFSRDGSTAAGLHFGNGAGLRYTWNGDPATYDWGSGFNLPDGQWVLAALVVEPDRATIYVHDGTLQASVNPVPHAPEEFDGETRLGWDSANANRYFVGTLDDVRIYNYALSAAEVDELFQLGGRAAAPRPLDGGSLVDPAGELHWVAGLGADSHDVYLGTSYAAVRAATPASPEYQGNQATTAFAPGPLAPGTTWFWRVDEVVGATTVEGRVWQFTPTLSGHWRLDEASGTLAADDEANWDAEYVGGPALGEPGASPQTATAVRLDGVNDRVRIPATNLGSNRVSFTGWFRRNGDQNDFAGLIFSRAGNTVAGLNLGDHNELRYHWDNGNWPWDSGLVLPDDQWVFVALVVEPERATIYLGDGGVLSSAVDGSAHEAEEFDGYTLIGRDNFGSARYFDGWADDVRIFDTALSPADVRAIYGDTR